MKIKAKTENKISDNFKHIKWCHFCTNHESGKCTAGKDMGKIRPFSDNGGEDNCKKLSFH